MRHLICTISFYAVYNHNYFCNKNYLFQKQRGDIKTYTGIPVTLKDIIKRGNYSPELGFNVDKALCFGKECQKVHFIQ